MSHPSHVPLSALSIDSVNIRKTGRGAAEPAYAASIRARGILIPLIVRLNGQGYKIIEGGKRYEALQFLKSKKQSANETAVTDAYPVPVIVCQDDDADAREASLMANVVRTETHPVDQFEAFAHMIQDGATVDEIAERFAMKVPVVRQALSLARIAPEIRRAWREGKIGGEAAEAYAQTQDLEHQVRILNKLKGRAHDRWAIDQEIMGAGRHDVRQLLKFVGQKDYEAAGHHVNASLFDDDERHPVAVNNVPALKAMAAAKIAAECERLKKDGWGWAIPKEEAPNDLYAWRRLPNGTPTKEQKAQAGCTVGLGFSGELEVSRGYIKPGAKVRIEKTPAQKAAAKKATATKGETAGITGGLALRMSQAITRAAADVLQEDGALALRLVVATMAAPEGSPAQIEIRGMPDLNSVERRGNDFDKYFALVAKKTAPELLLLLAAWASKSLNMTCHHAGSLPLTGEHAEHAALVLNALQPKGLNAALRKRFDAADYFASVSADLVKEAITEMGQKPTAGKKADLVKAAVTLQKDKGWLPRELRTKHYDGPAAKAAAKSAAKAQARKKRAA